ncbi:hypothetical protein [Phycicoccus sp.]|uniref:hypothetical protein n=1 Tax=Phycicoccus sp. TaxID=1902410 RepID=UPI002C787D04|nr:hypothetical protein [Phycicoccus sp.]HMM95365.1 hypothetical protein [Phycicoccus sp.]
MATQHDVRVVPLGYDGEIGIECDPCGFRGKPLVGVDGMWPTPGQFLAAYLDHVSPGKIGVRINTNTKTPRSKAAMHAVYATFRLLGVPAIRGGSVVVVGGSSDQIEAMPVQMREDFRSYAAGAQWLDAEERM